MDPLKFFKHDRLPFRQLQKRNSPEKEPKLAFLESRFSPAVPGHLQQRTCVTPVTVGFQFHAPGLGGRSSSLSLLEKRDVASQGLFLVTDATGRELKSM